MDYEIVCQLDTGSNFPSGRDRYYTSAVGAIRVSEIRTTDKVHVLLFTQTGWQQVITSTDGGDEAAYDKAAELAASLIHASLKAQRGNTR